MKDLNSNIISKREINIVNDRVKLDKGALKKILETMSSVSRFEDDSWLIDLSGKYKNTDIGKKTIYFNIDNKKYIELVKYFALIRLGSGISCSDINIHIIGINIFLKFFNENYNGLELENVNKKIINSYKDFLKNYDKFTMKTKESYWTGMSKFFKLLIGWEGMPSENIVGYIYQKTYFLNWI